MTTASGSTVYVCCFCVAPLAAERDGGWYLTLQRQPDDGRQDLFAHAGCLRAHVDASIPLLSEIEAESERDA